MGSNARPHAALSKRRAFEKLSDILRLRLAWLQAKRPFDPAEYVLLIQLAHGLGIFTFDTLRGVGVPDIFTMTERSVKNAPLAILLAPRNRIIPGSFFVGMLVEMQQSMHLRGIKTVHQIDLIL